MHFLSAVRNLNQDTGTVTHQRVRAHRTAVIQIFQNLQALFDDRMAFLAFDVGDEADAASIMFVGRVV
jgi:hypothetical protein